MDRNQPMTAKKLYTSNTTKAKLNNHFWQTTLVTRLTDKYYSLPPGTFYSQKITLARLAGLCFQADPQLHLHVWRETCKKGKKGQSFYLNSYLVLYMYHYNTCQETFTAVELTTVTSKFGAVLGTVKRNYTMPLVISRVTSSFKYLAISISVHCNIPV